MLRPGSGVQCANFFGEFSPKPPLALLPNSNFLSKTGGAQTPTLIYEAIAMLAQGLREQFAGFAQIASRQFAWGGGLVLIGFLSNIVYAQPVLSASNIYNLVGEYSESYFRSNIDISGFIGSPGSNYWNFSQPPAANDVIGRVDVVPVSDGGHGGDFASAAFALRYEGGAISGTSWEYYELDATNGLVFFGIYEPVGEGADPSVTNSPPISTLPSWLHYGDSWSNAYNFYVTDPLLGVIPGSYFSTSSVDAYGMVALPGIGAVPCLRVTAMEDYVEDVFGTEFPQFDTNWMWIAPGIGFAAQVTSFDAEGVSLSAQPYSTSFSRVFLSPPLAPAPAASLSVQFNVAALAWSSTSNASGYVVQSSTNLSFHQWTLVTQLTNQSLFLPTTPGAAQQFYRVIAQP